MVRRMSDATMQLEQSASDPEPPSVGVARAPIFGSQWAQDDATDHGGAAGQPVAAEEPSAGVMVSRRRWLAEWAGILLVATTLALLLKLAVISSFEIPSESMHPTLQSGDRVLVNRLSYRTHELRRGDVVVFERPKSAPRESPDAPADLIKRVVGLPGETIETRGNDVYIDGRRLVEPYLSAETPSQGIEEPVLIPEGHIWVMGDNRVNSADSRVFGPLDEDLVIGRAFSRIWPPSRLGYL